MSALGAAFDNIVELALAGEVTWATAQRRLTSTRGFYSPLPPAKWWDGASADEVLAFRLRPGYMEYVMIQADVELLTALELAVARRATANSTWLRLYTAAILGERRRRKEVS